MADLEHWRTFVRVVECKSFAKAAEQLRIARSAVSRRVSELEQDLGTTLLKRNTRGLSLTEAADGIYERAKRILSELDELESDAAGAKGELKGQIRVAVPLSFAAAHLGPVFEAFMRSHPGVHLDVHLNDRRVNIIPEGFDFALRIGAQMEDHLIARRLCTINHLVAASPAYLQRMGTPATPEDLVRHEVLTYPNWNKPHAWPYWQQDGSKSEVSVRPRLICDNGELLAKMTIAGAGIVRLPSFVIYEAVAAGQLTPILSDWAWSKMSAYLVYPPNAHMPRRVRLLMDTLIQQFGDPPYWDTAIQNKQRAV